MSEKFKFKSNKKKEKWQLFKYADECINTDILRLPDIYLKGNTGVTVEGCKGVFEYTDTYIKLNLIKGSFIILGNKLSINSFEQEKIVIAGRITSVEFCM